METTSASSEAVTDNSSPQHEASDAMDFKEDTQDAGSDEQAEQNLMQLIIQGHHERTSTLTDTAEIK